MKRRGLVLAGLAMAAGLASCIELAVDPDLIGSIEFTAPSSPSIVLGDTLRDTTGAVETLRARVFAADGDEISDAGVVFVNSDTLVQLADGNIVVSRGDATGTARIFAVAGGLQSSARTIEVIRRPDSIAAITTEDTVLYRPTVTGTAIDSSTSVGFVVRSGTTTVNAVRVTFSIWRQGVVLASGDTSTYALIGAFGRVSTVDTTDATGVAARTLRVRTIAGTALRDTIEVRADVSLGGLPLKGAPAVATIVIFPAS